MVPEEHSQKLVVSITLGAESRAAFSHPDRFIRKLDALGVAVPKSRHLGSDFNEIGKYMIALATPNAPIDLRAIINYLGIPKAREKLDGYIEKVRDLQREMHNIFIKDIKIPNHIKIEAEKFLRREGKEISENSVFMKILHTDKLLDSCIASVDSIKKLKSLRLERALLGRREKNLFSDAVIKTVMIYAYVAKKSGASHFGWDDLSNISHRGLMGRLATAVSHLPSQGGLKGLFREWLEDLQLPSTYIQEIIPSSGICAQCKSKFPVVRDKFGNKLYQLLLACPNCRIRINRHDNAAQLSARKLSETVAAENHYSQSSMINYW